MLLHTKLEGWEVEELHELEGAEFSAALRFTHGKWGRKDIFIFPLSFEPEIVEVWQVAALDFVVFDGSFLSHLSIQPNKGVETLFKVAAKASWAYYEKKFFYFESTNGDSYVYSVADKEELGKFFRELIGSSIKTIVETGANQGKIMLRLEAPYLAANFLLTSPVQSMAGFADFAKEARLRCEEVETAEYYEKCGGYFLGRGSSKTEVQGIFTKEAGLFCYSPDNFFRTIATSKLLKTNHLRLSLPGAPCSFYKKIINDEDFLIDLSHDILVIKDKKTGRIFCLEMYGERCVGLKRTGENDFLALTEDAHDGFTNSDPLNLRAFKRNSLGKFYWDNNSIGSIQGTVVRPDCCQLDDDTIVFTRDADYNIYSSFEMWSISKGKIVDPINGFENLKRATSEPYVCHMERIIMVDSAWCSKAWPMIVVRIYAPKEYCDVFALIYPGKKYRVYGKVYNMLADSMLRGPKTVHGLVKMFKENRALKLKYSL